MPPLIHLITTIEMGGAEKQLLILAKEQAKRDFGVVVIPLKGKPELLQSFQEAGVTVDLSVISKPFLYQLTYLFKNLIQKD